MTHEEIQALSVTKKGLYFAHSFHRSLAGNPVQGTDLDYIKSLTDEDAKKQLDFLTETSQKLVKVTRGGI